jgi:uncharacterized membrane protein
VSITFLQPWWLLLLLLIPVTVWMGRKSLAGLGPWRRWIAVGFRSVIIALLAAVMADVQWVRKSDRLSTIFVLDHSQSVPEDQSKRALDVIAEAMKKRTHPEDQPGIIVFGKEARIELPPYGYPREQTVAGVTSTLDRLYSDPGAGIKLALGSFPPDTSRRIVLFSDGNQNRGNAVAQALSAGNQGVPIDVVPIEYRYDSEVLVDRLVLPPELKKGDTTNLRVVLRSTRAASGKLRIQRVGTEKSTTVAEERVTLQPGLNVLSRRLTVDEPDFYQYEARFEPDADAGDTLARNNQANNFTWIRGKGRLLFIDYSRGGQGVGENAGGGGDYGWFVDQLRREEMEVVVKAPSNVRANLAELRQYDAIMLPNIPAEMLGEQVMDALTAATRELGVGLIMTGGPDSFGAGGYIGTPIEKAMPVNMSIKGTKIRGKGALVMIMHASEIPEGNFWQKKIAKLAIERLSPGDEAGLIAWDGKDGWVFTLQEVGDGALMFRRIDKLQPGDAPDFEPMMKTGLNALLKSDAMTKHMIIISDGDPSPPTAAILNGLKNGRISCTTCAVAAHGFTERTQMKRIADATGGRYYDVRDPRALPQIYIKEARVVTRPLIFEQAEPWQPKLYFPTEPVAGLPRDLPGIRGFVLTTPKPTAEVALSSPIPKENPINPVLAHWQYGIGKAMAWTPDLGERWAVPWRNSPAFAKFWAQAIRWCMRAGDSENLSVSTTEKDGRLKIVVNAVDKDSEFINFLQMKGKAINPDLTSKEIDFRQTEPGKYEAELETDQAGSYMIRIASRDSAGREAVISTGTNVSYPPEFRDTESNRDLLENIATVSGGRVLSWAEANNTDFFLHDRPPTLRLRDAWPPVLLAALVLLFFDVAIRRIAIEPREVKALSMRLYDRMMGRQTVEVTPMMERLRSRKAEVGEQLATRTRFEARLDAPVEATPILGSGPDEPDRPKLSPPPAAPAGDSLSPKPEPGGYASRLLEAKRKALTERDKPKE